MYRLDHTRLVILIHYFDAILIFTSESSQNAPYFTRFSFDLFFILILFTPVIHIHNTSTPQFNSSMYLLG